MNYFNIFLHAPLSIKIILIGLLLASIWSWSLIFQKMFQLARMRQKFRRFEQLFWSGESLDELQSMLERKKHDPIYGIFVAGIQELSTEKASDASKAERVETIMNAHLERAVNDFSRNLSFLSNLGTNGVIVGLLGTVLGIINSFQSIANEKNTSLAVVAPGIAEALFATAISLMAALPAAIASNKISYDLEIFTNDVRCFIKEFKTIVARQ